QAPSPVHSDVRLLLIKFHSTCWAATSRQLTELKQAIKHRTVLTNVDLKNISKRHVIWADGAQEFNVVITVVLGHLLSIVTYIDFHFPVETIVKEQIVSHADSVRLHWVALTVLTVVVVTDFPLGALSLRHLARLPSLPSVGPSALPPAAPLSVRPAGRGRAFSALRPSPPGLTYSRAARAPLQPISGAGTARNSAGGKGSPARPPRAPWACTKVRDRGVGLPRDRTTCPGGRKPSCKLRCPIGVGSSLGGQRPTLAFDRESMEAYGGK
uniref:Uncharacterized protein n=1 Tax=Sus scrofa TaxID=9823 RepID=A0A8D1F799_PIG